MYLNGNKIRVAVGYPLDMSDSGETEAAILADIQAKVGVDSIISVKGLSIQDEATALNVPNSEGRRGYDGGTNRISDADPSMIEMYNHVIHGLRDGKVTLHAPTIADTGDQSDEEMIWPHIPGTAAMSGTDARRFRRGDYRSLAVFPNKDNTDYYWFFTCMAVIATKYDAEVDGLQPLSVDMVADGMILIITNGTYIVI